MSQAWGRGPRGERTRGMPAPESQGHRNAQSIRVQRGQATCLRSHSRMCVIPRQWRSTGSGPGKRGTTNKAAAVPPCIGPGALPLPAGNSLGQTMSFGPWSVTRSTVAASEQKSRAASWFHLCSLPSASGTPSPRWDVLLGPQSQKAPRTEPQVTQKDTAWEPQISLRVWSGGDRRACPQPGSVPGARV